jgi:TolB protein
LFRSFALGTALAGGACSNEDSPLAPDPIAPAAEALAPAGTSRIVFSAPGVGGQNDIYSISPDGRDLRNLTQSSANDVEPALSPDGRRIAFARMASSVSEIYVMGADGSRPRPLTSFGQYGPEGDAWDPAWSPDSRQIVFVGYDPRVDPDNGDSDLYVMSASGRNVRLLLGGPDEATNDQQPSWSPDGRRIAFSRSLDVHSVMLVNADGSGIAPFAPCSVARCASPRWSPDGTRLAYKVATSLMIASETGTPEAIADDVFSGRVAWAPDGTRLVFSGLVRNPDGTGQVQLVTISSNGSNRQPVDATPAGALDPSWGKSR